MILWRLDFSTSRSSALLFFACWLRISFYLAAKKACSTSHFMAYYIQIRQGKRAPKLEWAVIVPNPGTDPCPEARGTDQQEQNHVLHSRDRARPHSKHSSEPGESTDPQTEVGLLKELRCMNDEGKRSPRAIATLKPSSKTVWHASQAMMWNNLTSFVAPV